MFAAGPISSLPYSSDSSSSGGTQDGALSASLVINDSSPAFARLVASLSPAGPLPLTITATVLTGGIRAGGGVSLSCLISVSSFQASLLLSAGGMAGGLVLGPASLAGSVRPGGEWGSFLSLSSSGGVSPGLLLAGDGGDNQILLTAPAWAGGLVKSGGWASPQAVVVAVSAVAGVVYAMAGQGNLSLSGPGVSPAVLWGGSTQSNLLLPVVAVFDGSSLGGAVDAAWSVVVALSSAVLTGGAILGGPGAMAGLLPVTGGLSGSFLLDGAWASPLLPVSASLFSGRLAARGGWAETGPALSYSTGGSVWGAGAFSSPLSRILADVDGLSIIGRALVTHLYQLALAKTLDGGGPLTLSRRMGEVRALTSLVESLLILGNFDQINALSRTVADERTL